MQARALIMLVIAVALGGVAAYLVNKQIQPKEESVTVITAETRPVVVAALDLNVGTRLDPVMVKTVDWPVNLLPKGAYEDVELVVGKEEERRVVLREMQEGEVVLPAKLSGEGARGGLTPRIPANMRAITISVNEVRGVAGFVLPGDKVDLLLTSSIGQASKSPVTRLLMQNVLVLAVAQTSNQKKNEPKLVRSITVLTKPKQAEMLTLAQTVGSLTLVLRNESDVDQLKPGSVTLADLIGTTAPTPTPPPIVVKKEMPSKPMVRRAAAPSTPKVEVIRGLSVQKQKVAIAKLGAGSEADKK